MVVRYAIIYSISEHVSLLQYRLLILVSGQATASLLLLALQGQCMPSWWTAGEGRGWECEFVGKKLHEFNIITIVHNGQKSPKFRHFKAISASFFSAFGIHFTLQAPAARHEANG